MWSHRLELEALDHVESSFVTLTYAKDEIRELNPRDLQLWLKRFRKFVFPITIRYFAVGEYGDLSWRPHYHVALFGWPSCRLGRKIGGPCPCHACSAVRQTWGFGHVMVGRLEKKSSSYIAGYVTKKMTSRLDSRLGGRHPEFARMSLNPGIGANAMHDVASAIIQYRPKSVDVPVGLQWQKNTVRPLGKYLRRRLRKLIGRCENAPAETLQEVANQMRILRAFAWENDRSVSSVFEELFAPYEAALESKLKLQQRMI